MTYSVLRWCLVFFWAGWVVVPGAAQEDIRVTPLTEGVWLVDGAGERLGVVTGVEEDGSLMIDTGSPELAASVKAGLQDRGIDLPSVVVNTHWHHAFANAEYRPARIIGHHSLRDVLARENPMFTRVISPFAPDYWPDETFGDRTILNWGDRRIELIHYPAAHTGGDVVVWLPQERILFSGDLIVPHVPWIDLDAGGSIDGWIAAVGDLASWLPDDAVIVPGHDTLMTYDGLIEFQELLLESRSLVAKAMYSGTARDEIVSIPLGEWESWVGMVPPVLFVENVLDDLGRARIPVGSTDCNWVNGRWYDGSGFVRGDWGVRDGKFTTASTDTECRVDLNGAFVVPAYGDAHKHDLNGMGPIESEDRTYLEAGVFYVMQQDPIIGVHDSIRSYFRDPSTVDVIYHEGVVTPSWGFITGLYRSLATQGVFGRGISLNAIDQKRLFIVDDQADLDRKWERLIQQNSDFIKVILAYSDEFDERRSDTLRYSGTSQPGLDPSLLPELVRRAHASGRRVSVHPETRADFRVAVESGADIVAHLPASWMMGEAAGYEPGELEPYLLTENDARRAAELGTMVITTAQPFDSTSWEDFRAVHTHNLRLLRENAVRVVLGSDGDASTANQDVFYISELDVYSTPELVSMLVSETPRAIFPTRNIGTIADGAEASFVVLQGDPLADIQNLRRIDLAVKQGALVVGELPGPSGD